MGRLKKKTTKNATQKDRGEGGRGRRRRILKRIECKVGLKKLMRKKPKKKKKKLILELKKSCLYFFQQRNTERENLLFIDSF